MASMLSNIEIDIDIELTDEGKLTFDCKNKFQTVTNNDRLSHGIGLQNVKKRLQLLYSDAHTLEVREDNDQYYVHLVLHLTKKM